MSSLWPRLSLLIFSLYAARWRATVFAMEGFLVQNTNPIGKKFEGDDGLEFSIRKVEVKPVHPVFESAPEKLVYSIQLFDEDFSVIFEQGSNRSQEAMPCNWEGSPRSEDNENRHCCWLGKLERHDESMVILNYCTEELFGVIETSKNVYYFKPSGHGDGRHLVYKTSRTDVAKKNHSCGTHEETRSGQQPVTSVPIKGRHSRRALKRTPILEAFVVADKSMVTFHGNQTIRQYVMTIMSMVAKMFRHASLGARVNLVVTNLTILDGEEQNLSISHNAYNTMSSFCEWQKDHNKYNTKTTHDIALLITRLNICADKDEPCGTVGMAYISGMCQSQRRCSVVEDTGFDVAQTIVHELGHNLGISHDGYDNNCADRTRDVPHIMASTWMKPNKHGLLKWSKCSRRRFKKYMRSEQSWCLKRTKSDTAVNFPPDLPGVMFNADEQCKHQYGNLARHCRRYKDRLCQELWCEIEGEYFCRTRTAPPVPGTECAEEKWCMYGNCINRTSPLVKQDGGWSGWGDWGECSRSCGTGVTINRRKCNNPKPKNGGRFCAGLRERYRICNRKACPKNSKDFRTDQCESYNGQIYKNSTYNWKPLLSKYKPCSLYCTPTTEERFSVKLSPKVIDGTPCHPGSTDLCVDGKCHRVGCDGQIGSDAKEDICGVCRGNGTTCRTVEGSFNQLSGSGYVEVAVIPTGSRNIQVMETKPCTSFLALKGNYDTYYVNGNWKIQLPGQVDVDGTKVFYDRKGTWERLRVKGPTNEPLHVMILYQGFNLGITYKYSTPLPNKSVAMDETRTTKPHRHKAVNYGWVRRGWEKCSVVCGTGVQKSRKEDCVRFANGRFKAVDRHHCRGATKPKRERRVCNEHPCPIWWSTTRWSKCNSKCGSGKQRRMVLCMRKFPNGSISRTLDSDCTKDRPSSVQNCYERSCRVKWFTKPWSKCFSICGKGYRFRSVLCPVAGLCDPTTKPITKKPCYRGSCYSWVTGDWGECSKTCNYGYQQRSVKCEHLLTKKIGKNCNRLKKPPSVQICPSKPC